MKTSKLVMIATVLTIGMMSFALTPNLLADNAPKTNQTSSAMYVTFDQAIQNSFLLAAMHEQLDPEFLSTNQPYYCEAVQFLGGPVYITGVYEQWDVFFNFVPRVRFQATSI